MSLGRPVTLNAGFVLADFDALLDSRQFSYAETVTLELATGTVLAYTTAQRDVTVPPCDGSVMLRTYAARDVLMSGFKFKFSNGQESQGGDPTTSIPVDEMTLTFFPNANADAPSLLDGVPFLTAVRQRALSGAVIKRDRWYFDKPGATPVGGVPLFYGYASGVEELSRTQAQIKVRGAPVLLNLMMPRLLFQPNCNYTVYSTGCGADKTTFAVHDVVGASPSRAFIPWTGATAAYTNGEIEMETGPAINQVRTIVRADTTGLWVNYPFFNLPAAGDQFVTYPGCNRLDPLANPGTSSCVFFGRQAAFRAAPRTPGAAFGL